jgi:hypothetical protein
MIEHLPLGEHLVAAESRHFHRGRVTRTFGEDERLGPALVPDGSDHEEATPEAMRSSPREAACLRFGVPPRIPPSVAPHIESVAYAARGEDHAHGLCKLGLNDWPAQPPDGPRSLVGGAVRAAQPRCR